MSEFSIDQLRRREGVWSLCWSFLRITLNNLGISGPFATAINSLYSTPSALVKIPFASNSPRFPISHLSPLLFALCIEPFAAHIHSALNIHGIHVGDSCFTIALYADDVILSLAQPTISIPGLLDEIHNYSQLSGYKLNTAKPRSFHFIFPQISK